MQYDQPYVHIYSHLLICPRACCVEKDCFKLTKNNNYIWLRKVSTVLLQVDIFSFGMFLYELVTTHQPYELCDNVKELVLEGGRPALTARVRRVEGGELWL